MNRMNQMGGGEVEWDNVYVWICIEIPDSTLVISLTAGNRIRKDAIPNCPNWQIHWQSSNCIHFLCAQTITPPPLRFCILFIQWVCLFVRVSDTVCVFLLDRFLFQFKYGKFYSRWTKFTLVNRNFCKFNGLKDTFQAKM